MNSEIVGWISVIVVAVGASSAYAARQRDNPFKAGRLGLAMVTVGTAVAIAASRAAFG